MRKKSSGNGPGGSQGLSCGTVLSFVIVGIFFWIGFVIYHVTTTSAQQSSTADTSSSASSTSLSHPPLFSSTLPPLPIPQDPPPPLPPLIKNVNPVPPFDQSKQPSASSEPPIHVVFSTDCGTFQDWQTLVFFYSARTVKQPGMVTRIASGCSEEKKVVLLELYQKLFPEYSVHFTPDYSKDARTGQTYHFYNKPYGVLHWIEHSTPPIKPGTVVAICDPDFLFLRPLTSKIHQRNTLVTLWTMADVDRVEFVRKGHPAAQQYGLGAPWVNDNHLKFNRTFICGEGSPCLRVLNQNAGGKAYSVGPPYMAEVTDLHSIATTWSQFVPRVFVKYPYLLAEMYGYSMAAAHEELPHLTVDHHMVSEVNAYGEGWKWIDDLGDNVCQLPNSDGIFYPDRPMPTFIHYCQAYRIDEIGYGKRRIPHDIFSCSSPMLLDPNPDIAHSRSFVKDNKEIAKLGPNQAKRNAFVICTASRLVNSALLFYKEMMCSGDEKTNYQRTLNIFAPPPH